MECCSLWGLVASMHQSLVYSVYATHSSRRSRSLFFPLRVCFFESAEAYTLTVGYDEPLDHQRQGRSFYYRAALLLSLRWVDLTDATDGPPR
jgi:hypothetical protein